ncbi:MAG: hypothetical protein ACRDAX_09915 [Propionibacteriaceae bacterium]
MFIFSWGNVYADGPLGLLFGYGLVLAIIYRGWHRVLHLAPALAVLVLIKDLGQFFAIVILGVVFITVWTDRKNIAAWVSTLARGGCLIASLSIPRVLWSWALSRTNTGIAWQGKTHWGELFKALVGQGEGWRVQTAKNFARALVEIPLIPTIPHSTTLVCGLVMACFIIIISRRCNRVFKTVPWLKISIFLTLGFVLHILGTLSVFLLKFSKFEALNIASWERYVGSYLIAILFAVVAMAFIGAVGEPDQERNNIAGIGLEAAIPLVLVAVMLAFCSPTAQITAMLSGKNSENTHALRDPYADFSQHIRSCGVESGERVVYINEHTNGFEMWITSFELIDMRVGSDFWSVGDPKNAADVWTQDWSEEKLSNELKNVDVVIVDKAIPQAMARYNQLFSDGEPHSGTVYRVIKESGPHSVLLMPVC